MVEKSNLDIGFKLPDPVRREPQIVVMDPNDGVIAGFFCGHFGKTAVDINEILPVGPFGRMVTWERMEKRPKNFFGGDVVKIVDF